MPSNRHSLRRITMKFRYQVVFAVVFAVLSVLTLPHAMYSQEFRGAISGVVTDATGGTIAGAKITVTETNTNTRIEAVTESTSQDTAPLPLPRAHLTPPKTDRLKD